MYQTISEVEKLIGNGFKIVRLLFLFHLVHPGSLMKKSLKPSLTPCLEKSSWFFEKVAQNTNKTTFRDLKETWLLHGSFTEFKPLWAGTFLVLDVKLCRNLSKISRQREKISREPGSPLSAALPNTTDQTHATSRALVVWSVLWPDPTNRYGAGGGV